MALPTFGPDYLASPSMGGSILPKTAQLFIEQGKRLSDQIEEQSNKFEAQAKAPAIATAYANALTGIKNGDFSGFGELAKVSVEASTNPFLARMTQDALKFGISAATDSARQASADKRADSISARINFNADRQHDDAAENDLREADKQMQAKHETESFAVRTANSKAQAKYSQDMQNWQELVKQGVTDAPKPIEPQLIQVPEAPQYRSKVFGGKGAASTVPRGVPVDALGQPEGLPSTDIVDAGNPMMNNAAPVNEADPLNSEPTPATAPAPTSEQAIDSLKKLNSDDRSVRVAESERLSASKAPLVNEKPPVVAAKGNEKDQYEEVRIGDMVRYIPAVDASGKKITRRIKTESGDYTIAPVGTDTRGKELAELANSLRLISTRSEDAAQFISDSARLGKKITVVGSGKKDEPYTLHADGVPMGKPNPDMGKKDAPASIPVTVPHDVGKAVERSIELGEKYKKELGGGFDISKKQIKEMDDIQAKKIAESENPEADLKEINAARKKKGIEPLPDSIAMKRKKEIAAMDSVTKYNDSKNDATQDLGLPFLGSGSM